MTIPATTPADGELKPCPFCGSAKLSLDCDAYKNYYILCDACGCQTSGDHDRDGAIAAWNRRATPSPGKAPEPVAWIRMRTLDAENDYAEFTVNKPNPNETRWTPLYASPGKADPERFAFLIDRGLELIACECEAGPPHMWTLGGLSQSIGWFPTQREAIDAAMERDKP